MGHLANLLRVGVWDGFLQLECNGLRVGRTVPAVVHLGRHAFGIAAGEGILGLGQGADVDAAHRARLADDLLCQRKGRHDLIIFRPAGRENTGNAVGAARNFDVLASRSVQFCCQQIAEQYVSRSVVRPCALHFPPGMRGANAGDEVLLPKYDVPGEVCSQQGHVLLRRRVATLTGSMGAKPTMLLPQNMPLILGRSASFK